jgi:tetratricopeptide (TPR) repeat protein
MFCTACGTKNMADSSFCKQCGHKLDRATPVKISEEDYDRSLPGDEQLTALLERAYQLRTEGKLELAIAICEELLRLHPDSTSAHALLAQLYERNGDRNRAVSELERVIALNPASIADRMKLDELRGEVGALPGRVAPAVTLIDRPARSGFRSPAVGLVILACLVVSGAYAVIAFSNGRAEHAARASSEPPQATASQLTEPAPQHNAQTGQTAQQPQMQQPAQEEHVDSGGRTPQPPVQPEPAPRQPLLAAAPPATVFTDAAAGRRETPPARLQPDTTRTRAEAAHKAQAVNDQDAAAEPIHIIVKDSRVTPAGHAPVIRISPSSAPPPDTSGAGHDSQSFMAVGSNELKTGNYSSAIQAYVKALPTAGDDSGYVYQQIADCYRYQGDGASAVSNYQKALSEFQRLKEGGKLKDRDRDGVKVCQTGITLCK